MSLYTEYLKRYPELVRCLENARASGRFAHSFLIHSPNEKIRREFAVVLAQIAGCKDGKNGRPDVHCRFCKQIENGNYSDMHSLTPVGKMYQIKVGDRTNPEPNTLRDLLDHLGYTSGTHRKFGLIEEADRMNTEAQNALLKTLEEPPPDTTLILTTGNPCSLLPTTRSRCQMLPLPDNCFTFDFSGFDETREALFDLCFNCGNDLSKVEESTQKLLAVAAHLANDAELSAEQLYAETIEAAKRSEDNVIIKRAESRLNDAASGAYIRQRGKFLAAITGFCSQIFLLSSGVDIKELPNPELFSRLTLPAEITPERGSIILKEAEELEYTLRFNVNDELALRTFAINVATK